VSKRVMGRAPSAASAYSNPPSPNCSRGGGSHGGARVVTRRTRADGVGQKEGGGRTQGRAGRLARNGSRSEGWVGWGRVGSSGARWGGGGDGGGE